MELIVVVLGVLLFVAVGVAASYKEELEHVNSKCDELRDENIDLRIDLARTMREKTSAERDATQLANVLKMRRDEHTAREREVVVRALRREVAATHPDRTGSADTVEEFIEAKTLYDKMRGK